MKTLEFNEAKHVYTIEGKPLTGVTTILGVIAKPALIQWAANEAIKHVICKAKPYYGENNDLEDCYIVDGQTLDEAKTAHRRKKEKAGDIGTEVHKAIEEWIKEGKQPELDHKGMKMFNNFMSWVDENKVKFLESEKRVYSEANWYAGTCDFICEIDGKVWIGDIKTSSAIYPEYFWQTAAYQNAIQEHGEYPEIEGNVIVNITKTGTLEVKRSYGYEENIEAFLACLKIYRVKEKLEVITTPTWKK